VKNIDLIKITNQFFLALLRYKKINIVTDKQQSINQYCPILVRVPYGTPTQKSIDLYI
jgi:hypothetical protein